MKRAHIFAAAVTTFLSFAGYAAADPPKAADPASAQALFYDARNLMKEGKYTLACPKLEESLRLDYGIGTEFNLADCHEHVGKLATAWSGFLNVAAAAKSQNQPQREKVARERARALEPRLSRLTIEVVAPAIPGLEVKRDGVDIGPAAWGTAMPADPGVHKIIATAPGRQTWEGSVTTSEGKAAVVKVPVLNRIPTQINQPVADAVAPQPTHLTSAQGDPKSFPEPVIAERGGTQRTLGYVVTVIGLAGVGVGVGFGIDSLRKREESKAHCSGDICDADGLAQRERAIQSGNVATAAAIAGGAVLLGGIALVLTAPKGPQKEAKKPVRLLPNVALNGSGGGLSVSGVMP